MKRLISEQQIIHAEERHKKEQLRKTRRLEDATLTGIFYLVFT
jgi:hypothetical protein